MIAEEGRIWVLVDLVVFVRLVVEGLIISGVVPVESIDESLFGVREARGETIQFSACYFGVS